VLARTDHAASRRPDRIASRRRGNSAAPMASSSPASDFMRPPTQKHNGEAPGAATATPEWEWHPRPPGPHPIPYPPLQRTARRGRPGRWERAPCWLSLALSVVVTVRATKAPARRCSPVLDLPVPELARDRIDRQRRSVVIDRAP